MVFVRPNFIFRHREIVARLQTTLSDNSSVMLKIIYRPSSKYVSNLNVSVNPWQHCEGEELKEGETGPIFSLLLLLLVFLLAEW